MKELKQTFEQIKLAAQRLERTLGRILSPDLVTKIPIDYPTQWDILHAVDGATIAAIFQYTRWRIHHGD